MQYIKKCVTLFFIIDFLFHLSSVLLQKIGAHLLTLAMKLGQTFIITNAMRGWVEYSASKYVPALLPILEKITVIS